MRLRYTPEQLEFLRAGYLAMQIPELTSAFNRKFNPAKTEGQIKAALGNHRFICGRKKGNPKGTYRIFTQKQAQFLKENYTRLSLEDLTAELNRQFNTQKTVQQIRSFTRNHHVKSGRTGQFDKGHKPWNTGMKGYDPGGNSAATRFKKGNRPHTWKPIGSERVTKDGYLQRKITDTGYTPRDWQGVHVLLWEEHHGPVPPDHTVIFRDGDKSNVCIENLELLTRAELLYLNQHGYKDLPDDLKTSMRVLAKLETKKFSLVRQLND